MTWLTISFELLLHLDVRAKGLYSTSQHVANLHVLSQTRTTGSSFCAVPPYIRLQTGRLTHRTQEDVDAYEEVIDCFMFFIVLHFGCQFYHYQAVRDVRKFELTPSDRCHKKDVLSNFLLYVLERDIAINRYGHGFIIEGLSPANLPVSVLGASWKPVARQNTLTQAIRLEDSSEKIDCPISQFRI